MKQPPLRSTIFVLCTLISISCVEIAQTRPATRTRINNLPSLSETLAVAKSPYEPVTLSDNYSPGARNVEPLEGVSPESTVGAESLGSTLAEHKQSTRAAQSVEQEMETKGTSGSSDLDPSSPTQPESTTFEGTETESFSTASELETETSTTTTSKPEPFVTTESSSSPSETTTSTTIAATTTTTTVEPTTRSVEPTETTTTTTTTTAAPVEETSPPTSTTTVAPVEETSPQTSTTTVAPVEETSPPSSTTTIGISTTNVEADRSISTDVSTDAESSTRDQPETPSPAVENGETTAPTTIATTSSTSTTTSFTVTELPQTTVQPTSSTPAAVEATSEEPSSSVAPPSVTTEQSPSSTVATKAEEAREDIGKAAACNHLPTYDAEEIQKVFREETTYKNGTIRGKFTYINFDQRYRLVHYTRLPYGPVKIDLVEELGKPEQNGTSLSGSNGGEIPNSVLQLRNILPNSLFGFPFLGPTNANKPPEPKESLADRSNMYFYSTDSISTPNLLSPSVPVSLPPGQHKLSHSQSNSVTDTLGQSYYENLPVGDVQLSTGAAARKFKPQTTDRSLSNVSPPNEQPRSSMFGAPNPNPNPFQFQYALASQEQPKQPGLIYTYSAQMHPQPQPLSQYHYSPLPVYSFNQPAYLSISRQALVSQPSPYNGNKSVQRQDQLQEISSHSHQPHSHEHYVAPFMFTQAVNGPQQSNGQNPTEANRPRLKLKTSKSLNLRQDSTNIKSAQLRTADPYSSPPISSPIQVHRSQNRQRVGKQHHDLKPTYNSSPVVYHVLRSPVGRFYTLPQYQQSHSMAYDHDD